MLNPKGLICFSSDNIQNFRQKVVKWAKIGTLQQEISPEITFKEQKREKFYASGLDQEFYDVFDAIIVNANDESFYTINYL